MEYAVYVQNRDGAPLMPTRRFKKVKQMLQEGLAEKVSARPFTIRLTYQATSYTQDVVSGTDGGRTNIGNVCVLPDGICLYRDTVTTRNREIPDLMKKRKECRRASRNGERMARKRLAAKNGTQMQKGERYRVLPGCEKKSV